MMRIEVECYGVVIVDPRDFVEEEVMSTGVKLENLFVLHCSQLACEVKIMVYDEFGEECEI